MKNLVKILSFICLAFSIVSCDNDDDMVTDCACYEIFAPVCGDDGVQYSNDCHAECAGVTYTDGPCEITVDAVVRDLGDPALDGCGWVIEFDVDGVAQNHRPDELSMDYQIADLEIQLTYKPTLETSVCGLADMIPVIEIIQILD